jgi:hypothetical protein
MNIISLKEQQIEYGYQMEREGASIAKNDKIRL